MDTDLCIDVIKVEADSLGERKGRWEEDGQKGEEQDRADDAQSTLQTCIEWPRMIL